MIPKIIHYCWISDESKMSTDIKACIASWHKYLPDYQFINWNDSNFDWNICEFTKYNREHNRYAYCADYIRLWSLYNYGGIYLDSDVMVYKSFNELLSLFNRIITREVVWQHTNRIEAAILGGKKGDEIFKQPLEFYNNCSEDFMKNPNIIPEILDTVWKKHYEYYEPKGLISETKKNTLTFLDVNTYFNSYSKECFAQHLFKGHWCKNLDDCLIKNNIKIFLAAHKPIQNEIPKSDKYIIIDNTGKVDNLYNDNFHQIIDISKDEFTKNHNVSYGEGCAMRYLWKHPEILPDYIGFGHYRRMFLNYINSEWYAINVLQYYKAVIKTPFNFTDNRRKNNIEVAKDDHYFIDILEDCIKETNLDFYRAFKEFSNDKYFYACNCFVMRKEDFLEMCEICFTILDKFDKKLGFHNNSDVTKKFMRLSHTKHIKCGISWQSRLQGFFLEYLTDTFYRYKFGIDNCIKEVVGIPNKMVNLNGWETV